MCGCFVLLFGAVFPRFALILIEMFSNWNDQAFDSFWIGFAGWIFLPYTTVAYSAMNAWGDPINGIGWAFVILGFLADLGGWFGTGTQGRRAYA